MIDLVKVIFRRFGGGLLAGISVSALLIGMVLALHDSWARAAETTQSTAAVSIRANIARYVQSINEANPDLAKGVWLQTDKASFVHPAGEEASWAQIRDHFYLGLMGKMFTVRNLQVVGTPDIRVFDGTAIAQFHWDFVATRRDNGKEIHSLGRETQVYSRQSNGQWLLVHVHYSGPPVTLNSGSAGF